VPFVFIDQRGTGCSDPYPQGHTPDVLARLAHYGSAEIVADAEAIRVSLIGGAPWKIFGQSYGAYIVHRYVALASDSVVSASAHGDAIMNDPLRRYTARIESQHKVLDRYLADYPDDLPLIQTLRTRLTPEVCYRSSDLEDKVCGKNTLGPLYSALGFTDQ